MIRWLAAVAAAVVFAAGSAQAGPVGVEYAGSAFPGNDAAATMLAKEGVNAVKFQAVYWDDQQPFDFPSWCSYWPFSTLSLCNYQFGRLDAAVKAWQAAGFSDAHVVLRSRHAAFTASTVPPMPVPNPYVVVASAPPLADRWDDYGRWVAAVAERYDGDGRNDMPGLVWPIHGWEIESEPQAFWWRGTSADYIRLLRAARTAIRQANPLAQIILGGVNFGNNLDDDPTPAQWDARIAALPSPWASIIQAGKAFELDMLAASDAFDVVEFHNLSSWTGIAPANNWLRNTMLSKGYYREVWAGDATSSPEMLFNPNIGTVPYLPKDTLALKAGILLNPGSAQYPQEYAWLRAEQSILTVRKIAATFAAGVKRINFSSPMDWPVSSGFPFDGHLDPDGQTMRPVMGAVRILVAASRACPDSTKVLAAGDVPTLDPPSSASAATVYSFTNGCGGRFAVAWSDVGPASVKLPFPATSATQVPTRMGDVAGSPVPITPGGIVVGREPVIVR